MKREHDLRINIWKIIWKFTINQQLSNISHHRKLVFIISMFHSSSLLHCLKKNRQQKSHSVFAFNITLKFNKKQNVCHTNHWPFYAGQNTNYFIRTTLGRLKNHQRLKTPMILLFKVSVASD